MLETSYFVDQGHCKMKKAFNSRHGGKNHDKITRLHREAAECCGGVNVVTALGEIGAALQLWGITEKSLVGFILVYKSDNRRPLTPKQTKWVYSLSKIFPTNRTNSSKQNQTNSSIPSERSATQENSTSNFQIFFKRHHTTRSIVEIIIPHATVKITLKHCNAEHLQ